MNTSNGGDYLLRLGEYDRAIEAFELARKIDKESKLDTQERIATAKKRKATYDAFFKGQEQAIPH